jgi:ABC-type lipopolysaccharide export system ATPase subunit
VPVEVHEADPATPEVARRLVALIATRWPGTPAEHVGSSAVAGLAGKGIIDLLLAAELAHIPAITDALVGLGFQRQIPAAFPAGRPMLWGGFRHSNGIARSRVEEVLGLVGLDKVAGRRAGAYSLGMRQRLGIAAALLGDPGIVLFDEPVNGLDPDGIRWVRQLVKDLAAEGRTVFISSHLMSEMEDTADHLVVIGRGRLVADAPIGQVIAGSSHTVVRVRTPAAAELGRLLAPTAHSVRQESDSLLTVAGLTTDDVGEVAHAGGIRLHELTLQSASLEQAYLELSQHHLDYGTSQLTPQGA